MTNSYPYTSNQSFPFVASFFDHLKHALGICNTIATTSTSPRSHLSMKSPPLHLLQSDLQQATLAISRNTQRSQSAATSNARNQLQQATLEINCNTQRSKSTATRNTRNQLQLAQLDMRLTAAISSAVSPPLCCKNQSQKPEKPEFFSSNNAAAWT